jgi:enoyl-CoA hydratase/carnithine racemase
VDLAREGDVFVLRMRGGENRVDGAFLADFDAALDAVEAHAGPLALVSTGEGRFYSTGLDLAWLAGVERARVASFMERLHALLARLLAFPALTVAAVNGHAFAAGAMLALAHDFRVMRSDRGHFCLPEIDMATGQPLTPGMFALIGARLEPAAFHEALITGRRFTAHEAAARGIVHEAVPEAEVLPRALERARAHAGGDRAARAALKRGLYARALAALAR